MTVRHCFNCGSEKHLQRDCREAGHRSEGRKKGRISFVQAADKTKVTSWILDSGAVCHLTKKICFLGTLEYSFMSLENGEKSAVTGEGTAYVPGLRKELKNVLLVPKIDCNILSVSSLDKEGYTVLFSNSTCTIKKGNKICASAKLENNLYVLKGKTQTRVSHAIVRNTPQHDQCVHLLHRRLGHVNFRTLQKMESLAKGVKMKPCKTYLDCHVCKLAKPKFKK